MASRSIVSISSFPFFLFFLRPSIARDGREILTPFSPTTSSSEDVLPEDHARLLRVQTRLLFSVTIRSRSVFSSSIALRAYIYVHIHTFPNFSKHSFIKKRALFEHRSHRCHGGATNFGFPSSEDSPSRGTCSMRAINMQMIAARSWIHTRRRPSTKGERLRFGMEARARSLIVGAYLSASGIFRSRFRVTLSKRCCGFGGRGD